MNTYAIGEFSFEIVAWYDRDIQLWTAIAVHKDGFQVSDLVYNVTKDGAIEDVKNYLW